MINRRIKGLTFRPRRTSHIFNHISYFSHHIRNGDLFLPTMNSFVRPAHNSNHSFVKAASGIFCLVLLYPVWSSAVTDSLSGVVYLTTYCCIIDGIISKVVSESCRYFNASVFKKHSFKKLVEKLKNLIVIYDM